MSRYRVEKVSVEVVLGLVDGSKLRGKIWLAPLSPARPGPQTVAELAAEGGAVLPFQNEDGRFFLVGTGSVASVEMALGELGDAELVSRIPATLRLAGGHRLRGHLLVETGAGERASDVLKGPEEWIRLAGSDTLHWVAKRHLVTLEPEQG